VPPIRGVPHDDDDDDDDDHVRMTPFSIMIVSSTLV